MNYIIADLLDLRGMGSVDKKIMKSVEGVSYIDIPTASSVLPPLFQVAVAPVASASDLLLDPLQDPLAGVKYESYPLQVSLSLRFKDLFLYIVGIPVSVEWCIRRLCSSSITSYTSTGIHHA